jgi:hypothetical protein
VGEAYAEGKAANERIVRHRGGAEVAAVCENRTPPSVDVAVFVSFLVAVFEVLIAVAPAVAVVAVVVFAI